MATAAAVSQAGYGWRTGQFGILLLLLLTGSHNRCHCYLYISSTPNQPAAESSSYLATAGTNAIACQPGVLLQCCCRVQTPAEAHHGFYVFALLVTEEALYQERPGLPRQLLYLAAPFLLLMQQASHARASARLHRCFKHNRMQLRALASPLVPRSQRSLRPLHYRCSNLLLQPAAATAPSVRLPSF